MVSPIRALTSLLSAVVLLVLYRLFTQSPPKTRAAQQSVAAKLPLEILEMIIAHLIHDKRSLLACSLICHSWYTASVPHLHHTVTIPPDTLAKLEWPVLLENLGKLGLLPLVKLRIRRVHYLCRTFTPEQLNSRALRQIYGMTNIRELVIDDLDIPNFMPRVQHYFGHFLPIVQSLGLRTPKGSRRQIIFFIGLFEHLEDLMLVENRLATWEPERDYHVTLVPPFAPPLRGRLVMSHVRRVNFLKDMVGLFGGVRFRYVDIFNVEETQLLLDACAETLETVRSYPSDACVDNVDLSRNESLRTFEVVARSIIPKQRSHAPDPAVSNFLRTTVSTIMSPAFSEVIVFYLDDDFGGVSFNPRSAPNIYRDMTEAKRTAEASWHCRLFEVFHEMYAVRDFQLVLCADVWDSLEEYTKGVLKEAVAVEKAAKRLGHSEALVVHSPRGAGCSDLMVW